MEKLEIEKVVTFDDYQRLAMRTCTESSKNLEYMILGLVSEVGEVIGKVAKSIRDDNGVITKEKRDAIVAEIGDVMWMTAGVYEVNGERICDDDNIRIFESISEMDDDYKDKQTSTLWEFCLNLTSLCGGITASISNELNYMEHMCYVVLGCCAMAKMIGSNLQEVCQTNINKLTDRYNRNVIQGSGDYR